MSDIRLTPRTEEWHFFYHGLGEELMNELDLAPTVQMYAFALWDATATRVGRAPLPLMADCAYIVAKLTGQRKSIRAMKNAMAKVWGKRVDVLPLDRRRQTRRWVWSKEQLIRDLLMVDDESWNDFVAEWTDGPIEKIVPDTYWEAENDGV